MYFYIPECGTFSGWSLYLASKYVLIDNLWNIKCKNVSTFLPQIDVHTHTTTMWTIQEALRQSIDYFTPRAEMHNYQVQEAAFIRHWKLKALLMHWYQVCLKSKWDQTPPRFWSPATGTVLQYIQDKPCASPCPSLRAARSCCTSLSWPLPLGGGVVAPRQPRGWKLATLRSPLQSCWQHRPSGAGAKRSCWVLVGAVVSEWLCCGRNQVSLAHLREPGGSQSRRLCSAVEPSPDGEIHRDGFQLSTKIG